MIATYRLQIGPGMTFADVVRIVPYFQRLGVSHLYLSPITEARPGSTAGYDVIDHNAIREEIGGEAGFEELRKACVDAGLGIILDFVPNHAAVGMRNQAWQDVLAYGPHSPYAHHFDIDWHPLKPELQNKLLLAFLGKPYGEALDAGEIGLRFVEGRLYALYAEQHYALSPESHALVLQAVLPATERTESYWDLKELLDAYASASATERERAEALHERLAAVAARSAFGELVEKILGEDLHRILEVQYWRLSDHKTAGYEINYRRFFDINDLVALRMEESDVFFNAHKLLASLLRQEGVYGVRLDHIDGLFDPAQYLQRVRELGAQHVWVEKILSDGEALPEDWPVEGTTGYEFANDVTRVLNRAQGKVSLDRTYRLIIGQTATWAEIVHESKRLVMETILSGELSRLGDGLDRLSEADYHTRDFTMEGLRQALAEVIAAFRQYRTYLPVHTEESKRVIDQAVQEAQHRSTAFEPSVYEFIRQILLEPVRSDLEDRRRVWVGRLQQYTAPVMAKGVEDTALYRYTRLAALGEVGGEPDHFSIGTDVFAARARHRADHHPDGLLATATHDTKQGEDARMRLIVLSEIPLSWRSTVRALERVAARLRSPRGPSRATSYLFYQVLVSRWESAPRDQLEERIVAYMRKAAREAKVETSWMNPDVEVEAALEQFVRAMLHDEEVLRAIEPLARQLQRHGACNTISQVVLKLTAPGVPDFYQGTELLDCAMVDPDNRRPVDYAERQRLLDELEPLVKTPDADVLRRFWEGRDPRLKIFVTARLLRFRAAHPAPFSGTFADLQATGDDTEHLLAFTREQGDETLVSVVTRFPATLEAHGGLGEAHLALPRRGPWRDVLTGVPTDGSDTLDARRLPLPWAVLHLSGER